MSQQHTMKGIMSALAHCIDANLTKEDIADAYETLIKHQQEFLSNDARGNYLREEALRHFKALHPDCLTIEQLAMCADLEDNVDVKNACILKLEAGEYADALLSH